MFVSTVRIIIHLSAGLGFRSMSWEEGVYLLGEIDILSPPPLSIRLSSTRSALLQTLNCKHTRAWELDYDLGDSIGSKL